MLTSAQVAEMHNRQAMPFRQFSGGFGPDPRAYSNRLFGGATPFGYGFGSNMSEGVFGGINSAANMGMNIGMASMLGNMGMGALGLGSSSTLTGLSRVFGGTLGIGASMGLMMPAIATLGVGADAIKRQNQTQSELDRAFGSRISMGGAFGYGASRNAGRQLNDAMRNLADIPDMFTSVGELSDILKKINDMKLLQGVKSAGEFKKKFSGIVGSLRTMSKDLGSTMEEALPFLQSSVDQGFLSPDEMNKNVRLLNASSGVGIGVGRGTINQMQMFGAGVTRQLGGDSRLGASGMRDVSNELSVAQQMGILSQQDLTRITGKTGEEANVDFSQQLFQAQSQFMNSGTGRFLTAALAKRDKQGNFTGDIDTEKLQQLRRGEISGSDLMKLGKDSLTGLTADQAISFENEMQRGMGANFGAQMGMTGTAEAIKGILKESGVKGQQAQRRLVQQLLGVRQDMADALLKTAERGAEMMDEETRQLSESMLRSGRVNYYRENLTIGGALNKFGTATRAALISPIERGFTRAGTHVANVADSYVDRIFRSRTAMGRLGNAFGGIPTMFANMVNPYAVTGFGATETEGLRAGFADDMMRRSLGLQGQMDDFIGGPAGGMTEDRKKLQSMGGFGDQLRSRFDSLNNPDELSGAEMLSKSVVAGNIARSGGLRGLMRGGSLRSAAGTALGESGSALKSILSGTAEAGSLTEMSAQKALQQGIKPGLIQRIAGKAATEATGGAVTSGLLRRKAAGVAVRQLGKAALAGTVGMLIPGLNILLALSLAKDLYDVGSAAYGAYKSGEDQKDMAQALGISKDDMQSVVDSGDENRFRDLQLKELKKAREGDASKVKDKDFRKAFNALVSTGKLAEMMEKGGSTGDIMQKIGEELRGVGVSMSAGDFLGALRQGRTVDAQGKVVSQPGGFFSKQAERTISTLTYAAGTTGSVRLSRKELERKQEELKDVFRGETFGGTLSEDDGTVYFKSKVAEELVSGSLQERKALGSILSNKELRTQLSNVRSEEDVTVLKELYPELKDVSPENLISLASDLRDAMDEEGGEAEGLFDKLSQQYSDLNKDAINEELGLALRDVRKASTDAASSGLTGLSSALSKVGTREYAAGSLGEASLKALDTLKGDVSSIQNQGLKRGLLGAKAARGIVSDIRKSGMTSEADVIEKYKDQIPEQILRDFFAQDSDSTISEAELQKLETSLAERSMIGANLKGATASEDRVESVSGDTKITEAFLETARKATRANIAFTRAVYATTPAVRESVAKQPLTEE